MLCMFCVIIQHLHTEVSFSFSPVAPSIEEEAEVVQFRFGLLGKEI